MNLQVEGFKSQVSALILPPCTSSCEAGSNPGFKFFFGKALDLKHTDLEDPERLDLEFLWFRAACPWHLFRLETQDFQVGGPIILPIPMRPHESMPAQCECASRNPNPASLNLMLFVWGSEELK